MKTLKTIGVLALIIAGNLVLFKLGMHAAITGTLTGGTILWLLRGKIQKWTS